jgi:hypothetical protein
MAEIGDLLSTNSIRTIFKLLAENTESVALSAVGIILLVPALLLAYKAVTSNADEMKGWLKTALFICLIGGIIFSLAGPALTLLGLSRDRATRFAGDVITSTQGMENLRNNTEIKWLARLIPYDPATQPELAINRLTHLGRPTQRFTFVADYAELRGYKVRNAVFKVGGSMTSAPHVSAIIIPLKGRQLYPANARGLLQVICAIDESRDPMVQNYQPLNVDHELNPNERHDLRQLDIATWSWSGYSQHYKHYCELAQRFRCNEQYTARSLIGDVSRDWHPIGASLQISGVHKPCEDPNAPCQVQNWDQILGLAQQFGARAFLIENLELSKISGRIMIDFHDPENQVIPDIGI